VKTLNKNTNDFYSNKELPKAQIWQIPETWICYVKDTPKYLELKTKDTLSRINQFSSYTSKYNSMKKKNLWPTTMNAMREKKISDLNKQNQSPKPEIND
jgi:hypothetical protein